MMWKLFETGYEVSSEGEVRSLDRYVERGYSRRFLQGKLLKVTKDKNGYMRVSTSVGGEKRTWKVHRLVATSFLDNPDDLPCVNHKDGNKNNNHVDNLEWVSYSENTQHAVDTGLLVHRTKKMHPMFTGCVLAITADGSIVATMYGNKDMEQHGFDFRLVSAVLLGKRKSHKGCTFVKLFKERNT